MLYDKAGAAAAAQRALPPAFGGYQSLSAPRNGPVRDAISEGTHMVGGGGRESRGGCGIDTRMLGRKRQKRRVRARLAHRRVHQQVISLERRPVHALQGAERAIGVRRGTKPTIAGPAIEKNETGRDAEPSRPRAVVGRLVRAPVWRAKTARPSARLPQERAVRSARSGTGSSMPFLAMSCSGLSPTGWFGAGASTLSARPLFHVVGAILAAARGTHAAPMVDRTLFPQLKKRPFTCPP